MTDELRERIIAFNRQSAERKTKAEDLEEIIRNLAPIIGAIRGFLPDAVRQILDKYM